MKLLRPILTFLALSSIGPELVSGNTPLHQLLNPGVALVMLFAYGLVILIIREFAVRMQMGTLGLLLCGIAYGLVNEGLLAKTIFLKGTVPIPQYNDYGFAWGVNWPWMAGIVLWHALLSVMFPIALMQWLYPEQAQSPWLGKRLTQIMLLFIVIISSLIYFGPERGSGNVPGLLALWAAITTLAVVAPRFRSLPFARNTAANWSPFWLGMATGPVYYIGFSLIAGNKLPLMIFASCWAASIASFVYALRRNQWMSGPGLLLFLCGAYTFTALIAVLAGLVTPNTLAERLAVGLITTIALLHVGRNLVRQSQKRPTS